MSTHTRLAGLAAAAALALGTGLAALPAGATDGPTAENAGPDGAGFEIPFDDLCFQQGEDGLELVPCDPDEEIVPEPPEEEEEVEDDEPVVATPTFTG